MNRFVFIYGFTLFNMFFGAGNLTFPLQIGRSTVEHWLLGVLGLTVTGIVLPFLGLFVIKLYRGDYSRFFGGAGAIAGLLLPLFILSVIGPFGGIPRCITVSYGSVKYMSPEFPIAIFSFVFCLAVFFVCLKDKCVIDVVGKFGGPVLLIFLIVLVAFGIAYQRDNPISRNITQFDAFSNGFITGYQTMDLLAAFFFSSLVFMQIRKTLPQEISDAKVVKIAVKSSIIGMMLLMIVYTGMVFLGVKFSNVIDKVEPTLMLVTIANEVIGNHAALFVSVIMMLACFTTVIALSKVYAEYMCSLLKFDKDKFKYVLFITAAISFFVSLFDFNGITKFLIPVLEASYPSIISLTLISIFLKEQYMLKKILFYLVLAIVLTI